MAEQAEQEMMGARGDAARLASGNSPSPAPWSVADAKPVDVARIRPGDEVAVKATFVRQRGEKCVVRVQGFPGFSPSDDGAREGSVVPESIIGHAPRSIACGDRVALSGSVWTVAHIEAEWAWLTCGDGDSGILRRRAGLERVS